jgi:hypothetical protein
LPSFPHQLELLGEVVGACTSAWFQSQEVLIEFKTWLVQYKIKILQPNFGPRLGLRGGVLKYKCIALLSHQLELSGELVWCMQFYTL